MFNVSMSCVFFPEENRYYLVDVHYKVVLSFPYNPRLNAAFVSFGAAYIFNFASICAVKSRVAFIRVIMVYESTTSFSELSRKYISHFYGYIFLRGSSSF